MSSGRVLLCHLPVSACEPQRSPRSQRRHPGTRVPNPTAVQPPGSSGAREATDGQAADLSQSGHCQKLSGLVAASGPSSPYPVTSGFLKGNHAGWPGRGPCVCSAASTGPGPDPRCCLSSEFLLQDVPKSLRQGPRNTRPCLSGRHGPGSLAAGTGAGGSNLCFLACLQDKQGRAPQTPRGAV